MEQSKLLDYYRDSSCSLQWRRFLDAFAEEIADALTPHDQRLLLARVGRRFAEANPLPAVETLEALQEAFNAIWQSLGWGFVVCEEMSDRLRLDHYASPLVVAAPECPEWSTGFLEGVYHAWFQQVGLLPGLEVRAAKGQERPDVRQLELRRLA